MSANPQSEGRQHASTPDRLEEAARAEAQRDQAGRADPEPSLGARLGSIGLLGWMVILPTLLGLAAGRWLDRRMQTGIFFSAPLLMAGAAIGFWFLWKWVRRKS
ncbi:MAG: AtpZ/AtpI family protein [Burkholderiaceae bacterium]|jgi:ATP synthase protein I|nr:AtpZ/AtpI family protein [Burkholderiaceae bacterium]